MHLTLIPPASGEPIEISCYRAEENHGSNIGLPMTVWSIEVGKYTSAGSALRNAVDTPTDVVGWQGVVSDEGDVITAGEIDDFTYKAQKYELTLIQVPSSAPTFFS